MSLTYKIKSAGVWKHHLKDVIFPLKLGHRKITSSLLIPPKDSIMIENKGSLIAILESYGSFLEHGQVIGYYSINNQNYKLVNGENIWEIFSNYFKIPLNKNKIFYSWDHKPLGSGSIKYPGSYFKHRANIFIINIKDISSNHISIKNTSDSCFIRIWIFMMFC